MRGCILELSAKLKVYENSDSSAVNRQLHNELEDYKMLVEGLKNDSAEREKKLSEAQELSKNYQGLYRVEMTYVSATIK